VESGLDSDGSLSRRDSMIVARLSDPIIPSLRDEVRQPPPGEQNVTTGPMLDSTSPEIFEDEDDNEDEDD
jgi:hypothetical protein